MAGPSTTRIVEAYIEEVPEEPAALKAEAVENHFLHTPARDMAKESDDLSEEAIDLSMDDNAGAEN